VERDHPQAITFLKRDIFNINDFFSKKGVKVFSNLQVFQFVVSLDIAYGK
jgi:RIO kinase 1